MKWRQIEERFFRTLMVLATGVILAGLLLILVVVAVKGLPWLSWSMITQTPKGGYYLGKEGGIANAIIGSAYIAGGATLLALVLSLPVVLYLNVYARRSSVLAAWTRFSLDVLWGVPSIVFGAFGFILLLALGLRASLLGGIITVALLILPIMIRAMDEVMRTTPRQLLEASYAVGATRWQTAIRVLLRQTAGGLVTAVLIACGRGIGDAASVLFTAGFSDAVPTSLSRPAATLPLAIFFQLGTPFPEVQGRAYASALILTVIVLLISIGARRLSRRYARHAVK